MKTELKNQPDQVIELGKRIIEELQQQRSLDILTKWMSHYLAELLVELDECVDESRNLKEKECVELILKLWEKREVTGVNPVKNLSSALSILEVISTTHETFRSYRQRPKIRGDVFAEFTQIVDSSVNDMISLSLAFSIADDEFNGLKKWKEELPKTLSMEEELLIETLDLLLGRVKRIVFRDEEKVKSISELSPKKRKKVLIKKIEELIENQNIALQKLKEQL